MIMDREWKKMWLWWGGSGAYILGGYMTLQALTFDIPQEIRDVQAYTDRIESLEYKKDHCPQESRDDLEKHILRENQDPCLLKQWSDIASKYESNRISYIASRDSTIAFLKQDRERLARSVGYAEKNASARRKSAWNMALGMTYGLSAVMAGIYFCLFPIAVPLVWLSDLSKQKS
jgi:hypothetical protein